MDVQVVRFWKFAEDQFEDDLELLERAAFVARDVLKVPFLLDPCTQRNEGGARCWMLTHAEELNELLNPFGIDFDELREGSLDFNMIHDDPMAPYDPRAAVLFLATLWFLREHRCFSGVRLNVSVLARFRPVQFMKLITFSKRIVTACLTGVEGVEIPFKVCPLVRLLDQTELLTHVSLDRVTLMEAEGTCLSSLVATNPGLDCFALRNVIMKDSVLARLAQEFKEHRRPREFELQGRIRYSATRTELVSRLLDSSLQTLSLDLTCDMTQLFEKLKDNTQLTELELGRSCPAGVCLDTLASTLAQNVTLRLLTLSLDMAWMSAKSCCWKHLGDLVENSRGLETLCLRDSCLGMHAVRPISEAMKSNEKLQTLNLMGCGFSCADALLFVRALSQNPSPSMKVKLGVLTGKNCEYRQLFQEIVAGGLLKHVEWIFSYNS
ncbi:NLR family CARD domain-containing protein 3-like [Dermacentor albipictus]|uniref:NLR family CARD domain-containing protein 3-like n=1 Tax=Dermacentor albipictus TaxID=60249 RepID=UPI0038FC49FF